MTMEIKLIFEVSKMAFVIIDDFFTYLQPSKIGNFLSKGQNQ